MRTLERFGSGWTGSALFAAAILGLVAVLALASGCAILPTGEPVSLAAFGVTVENEEGDTIAGAWSDGPTWIAFGPTIRTELWSKAEDLWKPPEGWREKVDSALIDGKRVVGRVYPWEVRVLEPGEELPEWARWVLARWETVDGT